MEIPNGSTLAVLILALNVLLFAVLWCGVVALLSTMSGWKRLARRYAATPPGDGAGNEERQTFRATSAFLNGVRYRNCLTVTVGPTGIGLALWALFRMGQPSLHIPWTAVRGVTPVKTPLLGDALKVEVAPDDGPDSKPVSLVLSPDVGRAVLAARPREVAATAYGAAAPYPPPARY